MLARPTEVPQTPAFWGGWEVSGSGFLKGIPEAYWRAAAVSEPGTWPPPEPVWAWLRPLKFCDLFSTGGHCLYVQRWGGVVGRPGSASAVLPLAEGLLLSLWDFVSFTSAGGVGELAGEPPSAAPTSSLGVVRGARPGTGAAAAQGQCPQPCSPADPQQSPALPDRHLAGLRQASLFYAITP